MSLVPGNVRFGLVAAALALWSCAPARDLADSKSKVEAGCFASWSPVWQQTASASEWWAEFKVFGGSLPRSVTLEAPGMAPLPLSYAWGMWSEGTGGIPAGTMVVLRATDVTGATARTQPFPYLTNTAPQTDQCGGTPSVSSECTPLLEGMVSFTMDDSYESQDLLARPLLEKYRMAATIYHITNQLSSFGLLPSARSLRGAGHEVGSHTRTHPDLTGVSAAQLEDELASSKQYLQSNVGGPAESFASPMGSYNEAVLAAIKLHYRSHRTVNPGLNYMGNDLYELNADGVYNDSTPAAVCAQLAEAAAVKGWRILVFHDFTTGSTSDQSLLYPIRDFQSILQCAQNISGLRVVTVGEGAEMLRCASPP